MVEIGQNGISGLETGQKSNEADRSCSSSLKPTAQTNVQIDAWGRHAAASNGFADVGINPTQCFGTSPTVIGKAHFSDDLEKRKTYWTDRFSSFFPDGPESEEYQLIVVVPERLELRSFGLKVAEEPTRWSPVILERGEAGKWQQTN